MTDNNKRKDYDGKDSIISRLLSKKAKRDNDQPLVNSTSQSNNILNSSIGFSSSSSSSSSQSSLPFTLSAEDNFFLSSSSNQNNNSSDNKLNLLSDRLLGKIDYTNLEERKKFFPDLHIKNTTHTFYFHRNIVVKHSDVLASGFQHEIGKAISEFEVKESSNAINLVLNYLDSNVLDYKVEYITLEINPTDLTYELLELSNRWNIKSLADNIYKSIGNISFIHSKIINKLISMRYNIDTISTKYLNGSFIIRDLKELDEKFWDSTATKIDNVAKASLVLPYHIFDNIKLNKIVDNTYNNCRNERTMGIYNTGEGTQFNAFIIKLFNRLITKPHFVATPSNLKIGLYGVGDDSIYDSRMLESSEI